MARIRSLHPGQWTDEDFVSCGPYARLLALALRNEADDNGVFEWKPVGLKMRLFPVDNIDIVELLAELVTFNQIVRFEHNGKAYGVIRNFARYQRPKRPKPVHHMPDQFRTYIGLDAPCSELDEDEDTPIPTLGEMPPVQTTSVPTMGELDPVQVTSVPPMSEILPQMKEEGGRRYKKEEVRVSNETLTLCASERVFEDFRGIYPKPDGLSAAKSDWDAALKAGASPKAILDGLKRSIEAWRESQTAPRFIPNATRWLTERRWEDAPSAPATAPPKTLWQGPPDIRATVVNARSESFAVSYLDPCAWDETIDAILTPTTIACDKLRQVAELSGTLIERQPKTAEAA